MSIRQLSEQDRFYGTDRNHFCLVRENAVTLFLVDIERKFQLEPAHVREEHYSYSSSSMWDIHSANCDIDHGQSGLYRDALLSWWRSDLRLNAIEVESMQRKRLYSNSPSPSRFESQSKFRRLDFDQVSEITPLTPQSDVDDFSFSESEDEVRGTKRSRSERTESYTESYYSEANVDRFFLSVF